jgi:hypothetical protein
MAQEYYAVWSTADTPMEIVVTGGGAGTYTMPSTGETHFCHIELGNLDPLGIYEYCDSFVTGLGAQAGMTAAGFTITFDSSTYQYTISHASTFAVSWAASTACTNAMYALGFNADLSGSNSYTSTVRPYYLIVPAISARSQDSDVYEPDEVSQEAVSDGGMAYVVSKETEELLRDWQQQMESKAATLGRSAAASVPWTWEHFFKHLRGRYPFYLNDSEQRVYTLRAEGASFNMETRVRVSPDYDDLWNISLKARQIDMDLP